MMICTGDRCDVVQLCVKMNVCMLQTGIPMYFESYLKQRSRPPNRDPAAAGSDKGEEVVATPLRPHQPVNNSAYVALQRPHAKTTMQFGQTKHAPPISSFMPNRSSTIVQPSSYNNSTLTGNNQTRPSSTAPINHEGRASEGIGTRRGSKEKGHKRCDSMVQSNPSEYDNSSDVTQFPQMGLNSLVHAKNGQRKSYKDFLIEEGIKSNPRNQDTDSTNPNTTVSKPEQFQLKALDELLQKKENNTKTSSPSTISKELERLRQDSRKTEQKLGHKLNKHPSESSHGLEREVEDKNKEIYDKNRLISEKNKTIMQKNKQIESLTIELRQLKGQFQLKLEQWQEKDSKYLQKIAQMSKHDSTSHQQRKKEQECLSQRIQELSKQLKNKNEIIQRQMAKSESLKQHIRSLQSAKEVDSNEKIKKDMEEALSEYRLKVEYVEAEKGSIQEEKLQLLRQNKELKQENAKLQNNCRVLKEQAARLQAKSQGFSSLTKTTEEDSHLRSLDDSNTSQIAKLGGSEQSQKKVKDLGDKIKIIEEQLQSLREANSLKDKESTLLQQQVSELRKTALSIKKFLKMEEAAAHSSILDHIKSYVQSISKDEDLRVQRAHREHLQRRLHDLNRELRRMSSKLMGLGMEAQLGWSMLQDSSHSLFLLHLLALNQKYSLVDQEQNQEESEEQDGESDEKAEDNMSIEEAELESEVVESVIVCVEPVSPGGVYFPEDQYQ